MLDETAPRTTKSAHEIVLRCRGQYIPSDKRVPAQFEDVMGGMFSVRGYPESASAGDSSIFGSVEYRYHFSPALLFAGEDTDLSNRSKVFAFRNVPNLKIEPRDVARSRRLNVTWLLFFDAGKTFTNDSDKTDTDDTLMSFGTGLDCRITRHLSLRADWGYVMRQINDFDGSPRDDAEDGDQRLHLMATFIW